MEKGRGNGTDTLAMDIVCDIVPCKDMVKHRLRIQTLKQEAKE